MSPLSITAAQRTAMRRVSELLVMCTLRPANTSHQAEAEVSAKPGSISLLS